MNVEQANAIPLSEVLEKIGFHPVKDTGFELWYHSPFRSEKTPSFQVKREENRWRDHADNSGGTVVDFVCAWLQFKNEDHTREDALRWLRNMHLSSSLQSSHVTNSNNDVSIFKVQKAMSLRSATLTRYLKSKNIPVALAKKYLKEARVLNMATGKTFVAFVMRNEDDAYELFNESFTSCLGENDITFIRGKKILHHEVHVFSDIMDFLSALAFQKKNKLDGDAIILNPGSRLSQALPYIRNYTYKILYTWFANDAVGEQLGTTLKKFLEEDGEIIFCRMNGLYEPYKNVHTWYIHNYSL